MKLGTETGSFQNHILSRSLIGAPTPAVGMGATILMWTDRKPATIVAIDRFKSGPHKGEVSRVHVQEDRATRTDTNGMSECQSYAFTPNYAAPVQTFKRMGDGGFKTSASGTALRIGERDKYHDFSF